MDRWHGGCSRTSLVMPWFWSASGGRAYRAVWLWRSELARGPRDGRCATADRSSALLACLRALVPCPWLVASYDAEARAYNPDHDVYILAYYQNYHLISLSRHITKSRFDDSTQLSRMPVSVIQHSCDVGCQVVAATPAYTGYD